MIETTKLTQLGWNPVQVNPRTFARSEHAARRTGMSHLGVRAIIENIDINRAGWNHPDIFYFMHAVTRERQAVAPTHMLQQSVCDIAGGILESEAAAVTLPRITTGIGNPYVTSHTTPTPDILDIWRTRLVDPDTNRNAHGNYMTHIGLVGHLATHPNSIFVGSIPSLVHEPTMYFAELDAHQAVFRASQSF